MYAQYSEYLKPLVQKDTSVYVDMHHDQNVLMNLDIVFPRAPCNGKSETCILKPIQLSRFNSRLGTLTKSTPRLKVSLRLVWISFQGK